MKFLILLLSALSCFAGVAPNALHIQSSIPYRFGPVAYYSPNSLQNTMNGAGMSLLKNLAPETRENWLLWSEDFSQAGWQLYNGATKVGIASGVGPNGEDAMEVSFNPGVQSALFQSTQPGNVPLMDSFLVRAVAGTTTIRVSYYDSGDYFTSDIPISTTWADVTQAFTPSAGLISVSLYSNTTADSANIYILRAQLRRSTKSPAYVKTEAIRYVAEDRDLAQSTAASQPLLSRADNKENRVLYSDALDNAVWSVHHPAFDNWYVVYQNGADHVTFTNSSIAEGIGQIVTASPSESLDFSVQMHSGTKTGYAIYAFTGLNGVLVGTHLLSFGSLMPAWSTYSGTLTMASSGENQVQFCISSADGVDGDIYIKNWQVRKSSSDTTYIQTTSTPVYPGQNGQRVLVFDGTDDYMKSATFPFVQPETVMGVFEQVSWTDNDALSDGFGNYSGITYQSILAPDIYIWSGLAGPGTLNLDLGNWGVVTSVFASPQCSIGINTSPPAPGDSGASSMNGFTLGSQGDGAARFGSIKSAELFLFDRVLTAPEQSCLVQWLGRRNGINVW